VNLHAGGVSWVSPLGKALVGAEVGQRIVLDESGKDTAAVMEIE
jgi:transcription elongation GreA/GreB family factor